ncbi:hypothetical protein ACLM5H_24790 [Fredinandcohnia humi]
MRKWAMAGMLYVTAVILGFQGYNTWVVDEESTTVQAMDDMGKMGGEEMESSKEMDEMGEMDTDHGTEETETVGHGGEEDEEKHSHDSTSSNHGESQVNAFVSNDKQSIKIALKDKAGNPVDELEVTHEKLLHLVIVDEQLQKYYHVHPENQGNGVFSIENMLPEGYYKAFIDIKPKNLEYNVEPVPFVVGNPNPVTHGHELVPDTTLSRTVEEETVTLSMSSYKANTDVKLTFDLDETNLTPYLGAMGHVVILDEYGKKFLHVHPSNNNETVFETKFDKPGIYKIWAEFKQNGKVRAFPFVIEIQE